MAAFCWFYSMTPNDYWTLTVPEAAAMRLYMREATDGQ